MKWKRDDETFTGKEFNRWYMQHLGLVAAFGTFNFIFGLGVGYIIWFLGIDIWK